MPNPKTGTVTMDVARKQLTDVKGGKIDFKVDKTGIVHAAIGKSIILPLTKFTKMLDELIEDIFRNLKPSLQPKELYVKSVFPCQVP